MTSTSSSAASSSSSQQQQLTLEQQLVNAVNMLDTRTEQQQTLITALFQRVKQLELVVQQLHGSSVDAKEKVEQVANTESD